MIPRLFPMPPTLDGDLDTVYLDPKRPRMFPNWKAAMFHATASARRFGAPWDVRRDPEFDAWIAEPRP